MLNRIAAGAAKLASQQQSELELSYDQDSSTLTIELHNTGEIPIKVDKELVFMVDVLALMRDGSPAEMEYIADLERETPADFSNRFTDVAPGKSIYREVDLGGRHKAFYAAVGTDLSNGRHIAFG